MQEQINATIKQLLKTNNITASQIEEILVKALGQQAAWENCWDLNELSCLEDLSYIGQEEIPLQTRWIFELLWRSRIDLHISRITAEEVDLEESLSKYDGATQVAEARLKTALYIEKQLEERDREISLLKTQIKGFEAALELAIAPNLDAFKSAVDAAVNPVLLEKIEERDLTISKLNTDAIDAANVIAELDDKLEELGAINTEVENLKHQLEAFNDEIVRLKIQNYPVAERDREIAYLREQLTERDRIISVLDPEVDSLRWH